jgi:maltooligosyltrehalose synthase
MPVSPEKVVVAGRDESEEVVGVVVELCGAAGVCAAAAEDTHASTEARAVNRNEVGIKLYLPRYGMSVA